ncbi:MAG: hypothetical protein KDA61_20590, partial [Planctomycetales bacterium]|nr:hypothetical protein [Planctomycetales bacterium]
RNLLPELRHFREKLGPYVHFPRRICQSKRTAEIQRLNTGRGPGYDEKASAGDRKDSLGVGAALAAFCTPVHAPCGSHSSVPPFF